MDGCQLELANLFDPECNCLSICFRCVTWKSIDEQLENYTNKKKKLLYYFKIKDQNHIYILDILWLLFLCMGFQGFFGKKKKKKSSEFMDFLLKYTLATGIPSFSCAAQTDWEKC